MTPFDQGFELHRRAAELMLIEVFRRAPTEFTPEQVLQFVDGYKAGRRKLEDYLREQLGEGDERIGITDEIGHIEGNA